MDVRKPYLAVELDGVAVAGVRAVSVTRAIGADCGIAKVETNSAETFSLGGSVRVVAGFDGSGGEIFVGFVAKAEGFIPRGGAVEARDRLERMRYPWGGSARIYRTQGTVSYDDANIIRNLLEAYDIASSFASIESSPLGEVAIVQPIRLNRGDVPWNLIREFDKIASYTTYTRGNGSVYRRPLELGTAGTTYSEGVHILRASRVVERDGIRNAVQVVGLTYEGTATEGSATLSNGDVPDPPGYFGDDVQSNLIEAPGIAALVASRYVTANGNTPDTIDLVVKGDNGVDVGDTIAVTSTSLSTSARAYFVTSITHTINGQGFLTQIKGRRF